MFSNVKVKNIKIDFYSNRIKGHIEKEFSIIPYPNDEDIIYKNLIKAVENENLIIGFEKYNNKNTVEINLHNMNIFYVKRYLEEILAFKDEVINDMSQAKTDIEINQSHIKNVFFILILEYQLYYYFYFFLY